MSTQSEASLRAQPTNCAGPFRGPAPRAWVLNLDAEHELAAHRSYAPTADLRAIVARERMRLIGSLVGPHDVVLDDDDPVRADRARELREARGRDARRSPRAARVAG